jgi:hypothetical protein
MRSLLGSSLVVVGKGLELTCDCLIGHALGGAEQGLSRSQVFLASLRNPEGHRVLTRFSDTWSKAIMSQGKQLRSLARRALKRSTHVFEQRGVRHA